MQFRSKVRFWEREITKVMTELGAQSGHCVWAASHSSKSRCQHLALHGVRTRKLRLAIWKSLKI